MTGSKPVALPLGDTPVALEAINSFAVNAAAVEIMSYMLRADALPAACAECCVAEMYSRHGQ